MLISPPVTNKKPPIVAIVKPKILKTFNFSLKKSRARIVIIIGVIKHTNKAGSEGPIISIAEYWARKNIEIPVKLASIIKNQSFFENLWIILVLLIESESLFFLILK
jgi:hypothetical protein